jgi:hypothetical protein
MQFEYAGNVRQRGEEQKQNLYNHRQKKGQGRDVFREIAELCTTKI